MHSKIAHAQKVESLVKYRVRDVCIRHTHESVRWPKVLVA